MGVAVLGSACPCAGSTSPALLCPHSPSGCTFWGKRPWSQSRRILWQLGMVLGAPMVISLVAGIAIPVITFGIPIYMGRKVLQWALGSPWSCLPLNLAAFRPEQTPGACHCPQHVPVPSLTPQLLSLLLTPTPSTSKGTLSWERSWGG